MQLIATISADHRFRPLSDRRAVAVHAGVAAAEHQDALALEVDVRRIEPAIRAALAPCHPGRIVAGDVWPSATWYRALKSLSAVFNTSPMQ